MQARVLVAELLGLQVLNRFNHHRRKQTHLIGNSGQVLEGIQEHCRRGTEQRRSLTRNNGPVVQLNRHRRTTCQFSLFDSGSNHRTVCSTDLGLFHNQFLLVNLFLVGIALTHIAKRIVIAADDFLTGCFADSIVIDNAVASHVHAHIRRALVRRFSQDAGKQGVQNREDFHVAVVVDGRLAVSFQVERVDHVHVVQVGRRSFVREVHRMLERNVPNREGLELGIPRLDSTLVFVVNLRKAHSHLSTSRARCGHHHEFAGGFNKFILAVTIVAHHQRNVARVTRNRVMAINLEAKVFKLLLIGNGTRLFLPAGQHHGTHVQAIPTESVDQAQHVLVIGNAQVAANLVLFDVTRVNRDNDFGLVLELF